MQLSYHTKRGNGQSHLTVVLYFFGFLWHCFEKKMRISVDQLKNCNNLFVYRASHTRRTSQTAAKYMVLHIAQ